MCADRHRHTRSRKGRHDAQTEEQARTRTDHGRSAEPRTAQPGRPGRRGRPRPDCPRGLECDWVPAAYEQTADPADKETYGNYDTADRPHSNKIKFIVLHDTEEDFDTTLKIFQNPLRQASAHYVVRSSDGHVTQMVKNKDVAWQAGNWHLNTQSIGIEQEGIAAEGPSGTPRDVPLNGHSGAAPCREVRHTARPAAHHRS
ncbi:N-acetylmuramoyl-L-alanine amidase [Streptomyces sp. M10(2022)]